MKNSKRYILLSLILVLAMIVPVFAESGMAETERYIPEAGTSPEQEAETADGASDAKDAAEADREIAAEETGPAADKAGPADEETGHADEEAASDEASVEDNEDGAEKETVPDNAGKDPEQDKPDKTAEPGEADLTLVAVGKGKMSCSDDGSVRCRPAKGYEVVSITADKDAEGIRAGKQIPELEIGEIEFDDGTTITAEFEKIDEGDLQPSRPDSSGAVFG